MNKPPATPAPTLRQILDFYGIDHSGMKARRAYFERRDRTHAAAALHGLEVTEIEPEVIELE